MTSAICDKMRKLDELLGEAGFYGLKIIDTITESEQFRIVDGLHFYREGIEGDWRDPDSGEPEIVGYRPIITVAETRLKVFVDGEWVERGPWEQVAEPALDRSISKLTKMIAAEHARRSQAKADAARAKREAHDDLVAKSRALFGGNS